MKKFRSFNLITGWSIFLIAAVVYLKTIEPTTSFWDSGEFITISYKLEVGHPPGAPFYMVLGNLFTEFTNDVEKISVTMNIMSGLASAFTILFLFWTITHLARKFVIKREEDYTLTNILSLMGAGAVGALAYTFSDTFWFSAVEAEVYALSSLFTAFVFWAILKWENIADEPGANRWLILIAYLMGLSIGVHLLNLLAIPAIVLVIYFKKYKLTTGGVIAALLISVAILGAMMYVVIPGIVALGSVFELAFVNGMGAGYHSGLIFYSILLAAILAFLVYYTHRKRMVIWNTVALIVTVIVIGYSSYAIIIIRSNADTPLDESNPDTAFSLLRYLNREQYGQTPIFYGNYFNAPAIAEKEGKTVYYREDGKYVTVVNRAYEYDDSFKGFLPRMWSEQESHIQQYLYWANMSESDLYEPQRDENGKPVVQNGQVQYDRNRPTQKPSFGKNLRFLFRYQIGYMYFRYFMWNFAGRQNDIQGHGELTHGNWISGIKFIDEARLGPQDKLPDHLKENDARNKYYLLPLILGIIGLVFHYKKHQLDFWVVTLLFLMTGLAIVFYLNQYPIQPRERDYAYAGSFYAFSIWIGIGVLSLIEALSKKKKSILTVAGVSLAALVLVPGVMAVENWDDHDRSGRFTARDFANNYLNSCEENAVIFTNGDNDTFPLWYLQEVEEVRTDVRVINLSYFTADWYISQIAQRMYESDPVKFTLNEKEYRNGFRDYVMLYDNTLSLLNEKFDANREFYGNEYAEIYNSFLRLAAESKLPELAPKDYQGLLRGPEEIKFEQFANAVNRVERRKDDLGFDAEGIAEIISDLERLAKNVDAAHLPVKYAMDFLKQDNPRVRSGRYFIPGRKFVLPVDTTSLFSNVEMNEEQKANLQSELRFEINRRGLPKNNLMTLDLINQVSQDGWERPVYFAVTASKENYLGLDNYLHREGLAYRLLPYTGKGNDLFGGNVNTEKMYENMMTKFKWGNIQDPDVYLDENNLRMITNLRYTFATLANALTDEGKNDSARVILDKCMELMPNQNAPYDAAIIPVIQVYYNIDETEKAIEISREYATMLHQEISFFDDLKRDKPQKFRLSERDYSFAQRNLFSLFSFASSFGQEEFANELMKLIEEHGMGGIPPMPNM